MSLVIDLWKKSLWKKRLSIPSFPTGPAQAAHFPDRVIIRQRALIQRAKPSYARALRLPKHNHRFNL